jgi:hypothetical protein
MVLDGRVRIPTIQHGLLCNSDPILCLWCAAGREHGLRWSSDDVCNLLDSIHRGFPIGSLLLQQAPAEAAEVRVGPIPVMGLERQNGLWVVDGQQRLTSLAVALGRPEPVPTTPADPFAIYFDAATGTFRTPPEAGGIEPTWVPLPRLLDAARLTEWLQSGGHLSAVAEHRARIFTAGKRLREYRVPLYVIRTTDEELLRTIFTRLNGSGKPIPWSELRDGLFGRGGKPPSSMSELANELTRLGMGRPTDDELLPCILAHQGLDVTHSLDEYLRDARALQGDIVAAALPVLRRALGFLRSECKIPHLRLLPRSALLVVLTRFFREHPEPNERTQMLLTRWVWRALLARGHDDHAFRGNGVAAVTADEEASMQALLGLVPVSRVDFEMPATFDASSAGSRLVLLGMASLDPRELEGGQPIHVAGLVRERGADAFRPLFPPTGDETCGPANRVLLPGDGPAAPSIRAFIERRGVDDPSLRSHAIDPAVAAAIYDHAPERALERRAQLVTNSVSSLGSRMAEWGRSDRPSLEYLMKQAAG